MISFTSAAAEVSMFLVRRRSAIARALFVIDSGKVVSSARSSPKKELYFSQFLLLLLSILKTINFCDLHRTIFVFIHFIFVSFVFCTIGNIH